ncbi:OmpA family protein [Foetidibacter luteolus]|uniref:OmpA family protein n=1 Tax=Foetidibacter luteolus TaxID=2608880 RepID=UPI00129B5595|nr:OmpA family protein [Foetidibacter luteolus]
MKQLVLAVFCSIVFLNLHAQAYKLSGNEVVLEKAITFETGTANLTPESEETLAIIKQYLDDKSYISLLRIEGHVSNGNGQQLSEQRALAVCKKLVALGVDCKRLMAVGFGNTKPVADNSTPEGRAQNNRLSFFNAALRGRLIGGMPADGGGNVAGEVCM